MHGAFGPIRDRLMQVLARKAETWTEGERREFQRMWPGYVFLWRRGQLPEWDRAHHRVRSFPMSFGLDPWWLLVEQWQTGRTPDQPFLDPLPQLLQVPCPSPWPDTIPPVYLLASTTVCAHCIPEDPVPVWSLIAPDQWPVHQIAVWQQYGVAQWVRDHGGCSFPHASPYRFQRDLLIGRFLWVQWALAHDEGGI